MNYIVITDIYGNKLDKGDRRNSQLPFIIIHTTQPYLLMEKVSGGKNDSVYRLIQPTVMHALYANNIVPNNFAPVGHIWIPQSKLDVEQPFQILLMNANPYISQYPNKFYKIGEYNGLGVWKAVGPKGYVPLGLVLSDGQPSTRELRVINKDNTYGYKGGPSVGNLTTMNEFNLLGHLKVKKLTIDRTKFLDHDMNIRLMAQSKGGVISRSDNNSNLSLSGRNNKKNQKINYTIQGELKMDDQCIEASNTETDNFVYLQNCNNSVEQKWYPYRNSFISQLDQTCLTEDGGQVTKKKCDFKDNQKWLVQDLDYVINRSDQEEKKSWKTQTGKQVVLIEPDNPWYINKTDKKPEGIVYTGQKLLNNLEYRDNADFYSTFMMDSYRGDMGYGYSYAQRKGRDALCLDDCDKIPANPKDRFILEHFDGEKEEEEKETSFIRSNYVNYVASCLLLVLFIMIVYRLYKNYRSI